MHKRYVQISSMRDFERCREGQPVKKGGVQGVYVAGDNPTIVYPVGNLGAMRIEYVASIDWSTWSGGISVNARVHPADPDYDYYEGLLEKAGLRKPR